MRKASWPLCYPPAVGPGVACRKGSLSSSGLIFTRLSWSSNPLVKWRQDGFCAIVPETTVPHGHWKDINNQRQFLDRVGKELGVTGLSDWYKITRSQVVKKGGAPLFNHYASYEDLIRGVYPNYPWEPKFAKSTAINSKGHWSDPVNQRAYLDTVGKELGIAEYSDWYTVPYKALLSRGGRGLFRYHRSLGHALKAVYPEYPWKSSKFIGGRKQIKGFWQDKTNLLKALNEAEKKLGIEKPEDWYSVPLTDLKEVGFPAQVGKTQLSELLGIRYPKFRWDKVYLLRGRYAQQKRLERAVSSLFEGHEILTNARKEADLVDPVSKESLELDIFIPSLQIAFEYQEKHHYTTSEYTFKPLDFYTTRDKLKKVLAHNKGISLIIIPAWWDGKISSLVATIRKERPDLLMETEVTADPISEIIPPEFLEQATPMIEGVGVPVTACFMTKTGIDPTGWLLFEKYDGVRGFWNPLTKTMYSRYGKKFTLPQEVVDAMPQDTFLDGELWFGRDSFQEAMKLAHRMDNSHMDWSRFKYMVFDSPNNPSTYRDRYAQLEERLSTVKSPYIQLAPMQECTGTPHMESVFQDIVDQGGEGIILRNPGLKYEPGRSPGFLKHKKFRDAEARVIQEVGPYQWECELPNGVRFIAPAGTTEFAKRWTPKEGDVVTFKHHGYLFGSKKPKLPTIHRIRTDLSWEQAVQNSKEIKPTLTELPTRRSATRYTERHHWKDRDNCKKFFIDYAGQLGFDPYVPENWKTISGADVCRKKGATLIATHGLSLRKSLEFAFPELDFSVLPSKKTRMMGQKPSGYWNDIERRKEFFSAFAAERGFNPLIPKNWEDITTAQIIAAKGSRIIYKYKGSLVMALENTFPEVDWRVLRGAKQRTVKTKKTQKTVSS